MRAPSRSSPALASLYELFSSMRFAISLLTLLAIASVIGTVLKQNEPYPNYVVEFGQFWFTGFEWLGLFDVYHSSWFLLILAFLVLSTSLCIWRNAPGFIKDMKGYREKASESSLAAMSHSVALPAGVSAAQASAYLRGQGFLVREASREDGVLVAAKKGAANKLGYFLAHIALVVICLGGLLDGNVPLKVAELFGKVVPETRDIPQSQIPPQSRLSTSNLSFRGNVTIPENSSADVVFLNAGNGYFVQDLPFLVTLKKFHVDYYSTGMPKLFASDLVVTDKQTGKETVATVKVNHPLIIDGVAIYQASFGDGGSPLRFKAWNLATPAAPAQTLAAKSLGSQPVEINGQRYQLEAGELRTFNIENVGDNNAAMGVNKTFQEVMQSAGQVKHDKQLRNLGPSITYKLRDAQGQAREYHLYMSPISQDGRPYMMAGMRSEVAQPFAYLRLPLDDNNSLDDFMRLRAALMDAKVQSEVARRVAEQALAGQAIGREMREPFEQSVRWVLDRFGQGGFAALESFLDERVPKDKRKDVAQTYIKIVQGAVVEVDAVARERAGLPRRPVNEANYRFLIDSLVGVSALFDYGAPVFMQLDSFDEVKATGLQITRSPGKTIVYLGSVLLVLGIICMFYIRELRVWVLVKSDQVRVAMASNRKTSDLDRDFERHSNALQQLARGE